MVAYYRSSQGGSLSTDEARAAAYHACKDDERAKEIVHELMSQSLDRLTFKRSL